MAAAATFESRLVIRKTTSSVTSGSVPEIYSCIYVMKRCSRLDMQEVRNRSGILRAGSVLPFAAQSRKAGLNFQPLVQRGVNDKLAA